jgi:fructokinase
MKESHLPILNEAACIYFGSLAQRSENGFFHIQQLLTHVPSSSACFYDINLRPDCFSENAITKSLSKATILKLNENELEVCRQIFQWDGNSKTVIYRLMEKFHLEQVILTKGASGSSLFKKDGVYQSGPVGMKTMSDSVGAGDAFAAMFCACTLNNWKPENALLGASKFASRICEIKGAIPESPEFYAPFKEMIKKRSPHGII